MNNNRDVKFRVWNTASKLFLNLTNGEWGYYYLTLDGKFMVHYNKIGVGNNPLGAAKEVWLEYMTVQQYTGLTDKNNKEIYEGDIVKVPTINGFDGLIDLREVKWDSRELRWGLVRKDFESMCQGISYYKTDIEVVGNIFENPETEFTETPTNIIKEAHEEYLKSLPEHPENGGIINLDECENCGEAAWDGYICHSCGAKDIGE